MSDATDGQSSHTGDDRGQPNAQSWVELRPRTIWLFTVELCAMVTLRGAAKLTGLSKEALRKIVLRKSRPNLTSRKALGELCLKLFPGGMVYKEIDGRWQLRKRLIELLPPGEAEAQAAIAHVFDLARRSPDEAPEFLDDLQNWLLLQVEAEYWADRKYLAEFRRKRAPKGEGKRSRPRRAELPAADEGEPNE